MIFTIAGFTVKSSAKAKAMAIWHLLAGNPAMTHAEKQAQNVFNILKNAGL